MGQKNNGSLKYLPALEDALVRHTVIDGSDPNPISLHNLLASNFVEIGYSDGTFRLVSYHDLMVRGLTSAVVLDYSKQVKEQADELIKNRVEIRRLQDKLEESRQKCTQLESSKRQQASAYEADKQVRKADATKIASLEQELAQLRALLEQSGVSLPAGSQSSGAASPPDDAELESLRTQVKESVAEVERLNAELTSAQAAWEQSEQDIERERHDSADELDRAYTQAALQRDELTECLGDMIRALEQAKAKLAQQTVQAQDEIQALQSKTQSLEAERDDLAGQLKQTLAEQRLERQSKIKSSSPDYVSTTHDLEDKLAEANRELADVRKTFDDLTAERDRLARQLTEANWKLTTGANAKSEDSSKPNQADPADSSAFESKLREAEQRADKLQDQFDRAVAQVEGTLGRLNDLKQQLAQAKRDNDSLTSECQRLSTNAVDPDSQAAVVLTALERFKQELAERVKPGPAATVVCRGVANIQALNTALEVWTNFLTEAQSQTAAIYQAMQDAEADVKALEADMELASRQSLDPEVFRPDLDRAKQDIKDLGPHLAQRLPIVEDVKAAISLIQKQLAARQVCCEGLPQGFLDSEIPPLPVLPWENDNGAKNP